jgi:hypothetical protein
VTPQASDFSFKVGNSSSPASWSTAPAPASFVVRSGPGGTTRVEMTWADGAIRNTWLQVTVGATATTGLTSPDVFYFGNAVGESGDNAANATVDTTDFLSTRGSLQTFMNPAPISNTFDYNRDGRVDATDQIITRNNSGFTLTFFTPADPSDPTLVASAVPAAAPATAAASTSPYTISLVDGADGSVTTDSNNPKHAKNPRNPHK